MGWVLGQGGKNNTLDELRLAHFTVVNFGEEYEILVCTSIARKSPEKSSKALFPHLSILTLAIG